MNTRGNEQEQANGDTSSEGVVSRYFKKITTLISRKKSDDLSPATVTILSTEVEETVAVFDGACKTVSEVTGEMLNAGNDTTEDASEDADASDDFFQPSRTNSFYPTLWGKWVDGAPLMDLSSVSSDCEKLNGEDAESLRSAEPTDQGLVMKRRNTI